MSIAQTSQLLQLVLNSAVMMLIALIWWGVVVFRLNTLSSQIQRLRKRYRHAQLDMSQRRLRLQLRQCRHDLAVRYRMARHSVLIMHYVLLVFMASLFLLSLRTLMNSNLLITAAMFLFVAGATGILLSVALALMEFYQRNVLAGQELNWPNVEPVPSSMAAVVPQSQIIPHSQGQPRFQSRGMEYQELSKKDHIGSIAS